MNAKFQDTVLETLLVPMHSSLALASFNILSEWRRHSRAFALQFLFKLPTLSIKIDASEEFARAAQNEASRMRLPFLQVQLQLLFPYAILMLH